MYSSLGKKNYFFNQMTNLDIFLLFYAVFCLTISCTKNKSSYECLFIINLVHVIFIALKRTLRVK